jgi:hypothetical protein
MSNHDVVLCRSFGDEPLVRVVWSVTHEGILICGQDSLDAARQAQGDAVPVLAPFEAIYEYDKDLFPLLDKAFRDFGDRSPELLHLWRQARPYQIAIAHQIDVDK